MTTTRMTMTTRVTHLWNLIEASGFREDIKIIGDNDDGDDDDDNNDEKNNKNIKVDGISDLGFS